MSSDDGKIFNCHTHVFTNLHVPDQLLPFRLVPWLRRPQNRALASRIIRLINPVLNVYHRVFGVPEESNRVTRLMALLEVAGLQTQQQIFRVLEQQYPPGTRFVTLSIDMDYMEAGVASRDFLQQIQELAALKQTFGTLVRPFLGVDPRRPGLLALVQRAHQEQGFCGLKLYPALGFLPDDPVLYEVYAYAQEHELPVVSHCSKGGLMYQGKIPPHPVTGQTMTRMEYANYLSHPKRFIPVLKEFSELRVCLAHFGGAGEWRAFLNQSRQIPNAQTSWLDVIADMMRIYPNLYTDLSYTISDVSLMPLAKVMVNTGELRDRILFGTDFFVVRAETTEREFSIRLRGYLGETDFWHIANHNPRKFL